MANIGKKGFEIPQPAGKAGETESSGSSQTSSMTPEQKFNLLLAVAVGGFVVCLIAMLAMLASTWQFKSNSYNEYSNVIREYEDKRYNILENRVKELEIKLNTTSSAK